MKYGAVIVAAGMTDRLKRYKQLMNISSKSIAERVIVNFKRAGIEDIIMITGHNADKLEKALKNFDITFIRNLDYETSQMFDSAKLGLERLADRCDRVFFTLVDIPFFTDRTVTLEMQMMDEFPSASVIVPVYDGKGGHPVLIDTKILPDILSYSGDRGMRGAIASLPEGIVLRASVDDEGAAAGTAAEDDYQRLVDLHNDRIMHPEIKLMFSSTTRFFGPGTVCLLKEIEKCGNVRDACEKCGFSYSKGWTIINNCEEKFGYSVVERQAGGQEGGMARVTEKGRDLLSVYDVLENELTALAEERFRELMKKYHLTCEE